MDIRLQTARFTLGDKEYNLCCNMNVLAEVQEMYDGNLFAALNSTGTLKSILSFLTAMVNDSREAEGLEPLTTKEVGRMIPAGRLKPMRETVMQLVTYALMSDEAADEAEENEKNS